MHASDDCPLDDELAAHVAGELDDAARARLGEHLDGCAACRAVVGAVVRAAGAAGVDAGVDATEGAVTAVAATVPGAARRRRGPGISLGGLVGRYRVDRLLGAGGMGMVYAAHDTELDRTVALKVLRPELGRAAGLTDRLVRESRLMARVSHPAVITVYDVGRHGEQVFVAMEFIAGATLGAWLRAERRPWRQVVELFRRAGAGLAAAHAAGLVHRDFKPDNVLLALDGEAITRVVVTDLGVARAAASDATSEPSGTPAPGGGAGEAGTPPRAEVELTATGVAIGTPAYMAPEQLDARRVDARADVFAFAVALWEALYGARPFPGRSVAEIRAAMARGVPAAPSRVGELGATSLPPGWIAAALRDALAVDPTYRTPTMAALLARLDPARHDRRGRVVAVAAGAGAVAVAAVATLALGRDAPGGGPTGGPAGGPTGGPVAGAEGAARDGCAAGALDLVWSDAARAAVRAAVVSTGNPVAARIADRAEAAGQAWVRRWYDVQARVCVAGVEPPPPAAGPACLVARRGELAAMISILPELSVRERTQLDVSMSALPGPELCATAAADGVARDLGDTPAQREAVAALRARLWQIDALRIAGDYRRAVVELEALGPQVEALGLGALTAEYLLQLGIAVEDLDAPRGVEIVRRAAAAAEKSRHDDFAAMAWIDLAFTYAERLQQPDRAEDALLHADAAIVRAGESPVLRVQYHYAVARLRYQQNRYDESIALYEQVLVEARRWAPDYVVQIQQGLAASLGEAGRFDEALALDRAAVAERVGQFGEDHVLVAEARNLVATDLMYLGDIEGALAELDVVLAIAERAYGPDNEWTGTYLHNKAELLRNAGRYAESLALHARARPILIAARGAGSVVVAQSLEHEAGALLGERRWPEAVARLREALGVYRASLGDDHFETAKCRVNLGEALRELGEPAAALVEAQAALAVFRRVHGDDHPYTAYVRVELGKTLLALGRPGDAIPEVEAALHAYERGPADPASIADAQFALARALQDDPTSRARAAQLARWARTAWREAGGEWTDDLAAVEAWLARR